MADKKHTRESLYNCNCDKCEAMGHSLEERFSFIDLCEMDKSSRIKVTTKVCLQCGPTLTFEVEEGFAGILQDALLIAGYDLNSETIEIVRI
jgi:hypothetical protein